MKLSSTFVTGTTVNGTTYQEYLKFACDATGLGQLYGGFLGYGIVTNQQTFTTLGSGTNVYVGIKNVDLVHTLDIVN